MIPRVLHQVWLGGPIPGILSAYRQSWLKRHPDWEFRLWTEREAASLGNHDLLKDCSSLAMSADIIRYEAVFLHGGVYVDVDLECLRPLDDLLGMGFFAVWREAPSGRGPRDGLVSNAVFGAAPRHPVLENVVKACRTDFKSEPWNSMGPPLFTRHVLAFKEGYDKILPRETFSPFTRDEYKVFIDTGAPVPVPRGEPYAINHQASLWHPGSWRPLRPDAFAAAHRAMESEFCRLFRKGGWNSRESRSGAGSELAACAGILEALPRWIMEHGVRSILDLGCGDWNWMRHVDLSGIEYVGWEIVLDQVLENRRLYGRPGVSFHYGDAAGGGPLPKADLVLLKDVLVHLPADMIWDLLGAVRASGSRLLAATTHQGAPWTAREGLRPPSFAPLDLEGLPLGLGPRIASIPLPGASPWQKALALYRI